LRAAAAALSVAPATAYRWWHRWRAAGAQERTSRACLKDRSSRPHRSPRRLPASEEAPILRARAETNLGPARLAGLVRRARSRIWKVLRRHGRSRRARGERQTYRRYEWSRPGALLHMHVKHLARFDRPGHRSEGRSAGYKRSEGVGVCPLRRRRPLAPCLRRAALPRLRADQRRYPRRALTLFAEQGLSPPEALMTDGAMVYRRSRRFHDLAASIGARHIVIPPYTPRWNGKVERFIQTLGNEWAYAHRWPSSTARAKSPRSFLRYYNRQRPHSSLGDRPPISRVPNVCGQDRAQRVR
ncbi:MAG TPA: integrase core domain-containing protein, partial [Thermoleophilaceae bacterium]|nr:integrase core domain-containing protein [Thermoleophilaceae bacterium]